MSSPIRTLARYATMNVANLTVAQRIELFTALAEALPDPRERLAAKRQVFLLNEAESHQLSFKSFLDQPQDGESKEDL